MRAFVALEISDPRVLDSIAAFQRELSATGADLKTVERENLHFTVKFLGEITPGQAREVDERLKRLRLSSADVEVRGVGAFPSIGRPNVIWAGVLPSHEERVRPIAQEAITVLEGIGERDRRPFTAHATLARVKSARGISELTSVLRSNSDRSFGEVRLVELKLKSSVLGPQGPTYADMGAYPLA
ncbi:MAG: RNA 2',3'-cyclic phosphodiesterase [Nitrososphaerales archaeon]|jgi:2'-5' RNA ligase